MANIHIIRLSEVPATALTLADAVSGAYPVEVVLVADTGQFGLIRIKDGALYSAYMIPALPVVTVADANKYMAVTPGGVFALHDPIA